MTFPIEGPIAPESNPPLEPQFFQHSVFSIAALSLGPSTTVTTYESPWGVNNNYVIGQTVRFVFPSFLSGAQQLNGQIGQVTARIGPNQFVVNINSQGYSPFNPAPPSIRTPSQVVAVGDVNSGVISATGRVTAPTLVGISVPGSFFNTSPFTSGVV